MATQLTQAQVDISWKEFEASYDFEKKFGLAALQQTLNAQRTGKGLDKVDQSFVLAVVGNMLQGADRDLTKYLNDVKALQAETLQPRANVKDTLTNVYKSAPAQGFQEADWAKDMDIAAGKIADNMNNPNQGNSITTAFDDMRQAAENSLRLTIANRMTQKMTPGQSAPKPSQP